MQAISRHVNRAVARAKRGYWSAFAEEDTLTGAVLSKLQARGRKVVVADQETSTSHVWTWEIDYHKFRSKPKGAPEPVLGADAIFTIKLRRGQEVHEKSLLMQAKIEAAVNSELLFQCAKLSTWREAAFVLNFSPEEFEAVTLDQVFRSAGRKERELHGKPLDDFISDDFLPCRIGHCCPRTLRAAVEKRVGKRLCGRLGGILPVQVWGVMQQAVQEPARTG
jgi:hypothetical protein